MLSIPLPLFWFSVLRATKRLIWLSQLVRVHRYDRNEQVRPRNYIVILYVSSLPNIFTS